MEIENINHENLYSIAKKQTPETIGEFINKAMSIEDLNYSIVVDCVAAGAIAGAEAANNHKNGGITGFQAGCVMWQFVRNYLYEYNRCGLKIVDFDDMLYPQHKKRFEKVITKKVWENLQKEAKRNLAECGDSISQEFRLHLQSIVDGVVPFGYTVENDD